MPTSVFLADVDALLASAGLPVPVTPESDRLNGLGPLHDLAAALAELVEQYPIDDDRARGHTVTLADPRSGRSRAIPL